jgi:hypothetical protein
MNENTTAGRGEGFIDQIRDRYPPEIAGTRSSPRFVAATITTTPRTFGSSLVRPGSGGSSGGAQGVERARFTKVLGVRRGLAAPRARVFSSG